MSVSWSRPAARGAKCGHRRCTCAWSVGVTFMFGGWVAMAALAISPSWQAATVLAACMLTGFTAVGLTCTPDRKRAGGIEALMDATREPPSERAGQRFAALRGHFEEWEKELSGR